MKHELASRDEWGHDNSGMEEVGEFEEGSKTGVEYIVHSDFEDEYAI